MYNFHNPVIKKQLQTQLALADHTNNLIRSEDFSFRRANQTIKGIKRSRSKVNAGIDTIELIITLFHLSCTRRRSCNFDSIKKEKYTMQKEQVPQ